MNREMILTALFDAVKVSASFKTTGRRLVMWTDVTEFPAMFVQLTGESYPAREVRGLPPKVTLQAEIWIYTKGGQDPNVTPETALNNALDNVEAALQPPTPMQNTQTLGGLVSHCWIEGDIEHYNGALDKIAKAIIPVRILVP